MMKGIKLVDYSHCSKYNYSCCSRFGKYDLITYVLNIIEFYKQIQNFNFPNNPSFLPGVIFLSNGKMLNELS